MVPDERPHIDAVSGQAAWILVQILAMELVKAGTIPKALLRDDLEAAIRSLQSDQSKNPAQKAAAVLLAQVHTLLQTADRTGSH